MGVKILWLYFLRLKKYIFFIIFVLGVHCDIYKSSYNVSSLNSPPPSFSFILLPPFLEKFQEVSFFHFIHEYVIFPPHSPPPISPYILPLPLLPTPQKGPVLPSFSPFLKKGRVV
jgi:hypothetical protein